MKKIMAFLLAFSMSYMLIGCEDKAPDSEADTTTITETSETQAINVQMGDGNGEVAEPVENVTEDGFVYSFTEDEKIAVIGYKGNSSEVTIPDKINGADVVTVSGMVTFSKIWSLLRM